MWNPESFWVGCKVMLTGWRGNWHSLGLCVECLWTLLLGRKALFFIAAGSGSNGLFHVFYRTQLRLESLEDTHIIKGEDDALSDKHGCPAYVSPEILNTTGTYSGKAADVWSLGVMLYTLLVGRYPFHDSDPSALFSKIRRGQFCIPDHISPKARCLIRSLLRREPSERLTAPEILLHPWFESVLEPGYIDSEVGTSDQIVPEYQEDSDISSFFC